MKCKRVALTTGLLLVLTGFLSPAFCLVKQMSLSEIVQKSDIIITGKVTGTQSRWVSDQRGIHIYTYVAIQAQAKLKGDLAGDRLTVEIQGGTVGDVTELVSDTAAFTAGEQVVLCLKAKPLRVVGGFQGKFTVNGGKVAVGGELVEVGKFLQGVRGAVEKPGSGVSLTEANSLSVQGGGQVPAAEALKVTKPAAQEASGKVDGPALAVTESGQVPADKLPSVQKAAQGPAKEHHILMAHIYNAWWSDVVDVDGDGYARSARLNWDPDVVHGYGSLQVFERISYRGSSHQPWTLLTQTQVHTITGEVNSDSQFINIIANVRGVYDFRIDIFRAGMTMPDDTMGPGDGHVLDNFRMEPAAQDLPLRAVIFDAWWSNRVDVDGDGYVRSARLNWDPDVAGGAGSLVIYEKIYYKMSNSSRWLLLTQIPAHMITNTNTTDARFLDLIAAVRTRFDFRIDVFRVGVARADDTRGPTNDADLRNVGFEPASMDVVGPLIFNITPPKASAGTNTPVTITGHNFGAVQGTTSTVEFVYNRPNGPATIQAPIVSWSDSQIVCIVPVVPNPTVDPYAGSAGSGPVTVTTARGASNGFIFRVTFGNGQARWPGIKPLIPYFVNENQPGLVSGAHRIHEAASTWNHADAHFGFRYAGAHTNNVASADGVNEVLWQDLGDPLALAVTWVRPTPFGPVIVEGDLAFNSTIDWSTMHGPGPGQFDVETVALHEFGHWLSLRDLYGDAGDGKYDAAKAMFGLIAPAQVKRHLLDDDVAGIRWIYGH